MRPTRTPSGARSVGWGLLALAMVGATASVRTESAPTRHVLFNSYNHGYEWSDDLVRGVRSVLDEQPYPVEFWVEHMDTRRVSGPAYEAQLQDLLRFKFGRRPLDVIVAADDASLAFLIAHRDERFPVSPFEDQSSKPFTPETLAAKVRDVLDA